MRITIDTDDMIRQFRASFVESLQKLDNASPDAFKIACNGDHSAAFRAARMEERLLKYDPESANGEKCFQMEVLEKLSGNIERLCAKSFEVARKADETCGNGAGLLAGVNYLVTLESIDKALAGMRMSCGVQNDRHSETAALAREVGWNLAKLEFAGIVAKSWDEETETETEIEKNEQIFD